MTINTDKDALFGEGTRNEPEAIARSSENLLVLRNQARELAERFNLRTPELLAVVLKVSLEEARSLLVNRSDGPQS